MAAMVSRYPRVSEWVYIGDTAINMAQVTGIEFGSAGSGTYAIVRLSSYTSEYEAGDLGKTWFKVRDPELVRLLREYVNRMAALGLERTGGAPVAH
jgi:hypothetical protein